MPIRFPCKHCGVRLSVSSSKAGRAAKCPKCGRRLTIPDSNPRDDDTREDPSQADGPSGTQAAPGVGPGDAEDESNDPFSEFLVYDDESELVYDSEYEEEYPAPASVDPNKVAVPRSVLYMQGILLGTVALTSFFLGLMAGRGTTGENVPDDQPHPCLVTGRVALGEGGLETRPDVGAVAIIVPQDVHPEKKVELIGLRPGEMEPVEDHEGLQTIRSIGGDYARADQQGHFELRVPNRGNYFLLVLSAGRSRSSDPPPNVVLAQIGRFFALSPEIFDGHEYRWQSEAIKRDRQLNIVF